MVGQWLANGWPMAGQWLANGWPMVGQCLANGWPMVGQWLANGWPMVGQWLANGWPMNDFKKYIEWRSAATYVIWENALFKVCVNLGLHTVGVVRGYCGTT